MHIGVSIYSKQKEKCSLTQHKNSIISERELELEKLCKSGLYSQASKITLEQYFDILFFSLEGEILRYIGAHTALPENTSWFLKTNV